MKRTTIFKQLILNVVIPVILTLVFMAGLNLYTSFRTLKKENKAKKQIMYDEIKSILRLQDMALEILEDELDQRIRELRHLVPCFITFICKTNTIPSQYKRRDKPGGSLCKDKD